MPAAVLSRRRCDRAKVASFGATRTVEAQPARAVATTRSGSARGGAGRERVGTRAALYPGRAASEGEPRDARRRPRGRLIVLRAGGNPGADLRDIRRRHLGA